MDEVLVLVIPRLHVLMVGVELLHLVNLFWRVSGLTRPLIRAGSGFGVPAASCVGGG
ncbi:Hypothetical predicted protein, partial [Marmota monax]